MRNYTIAERALIITGVLSGQSYNDINDLLVADQMRLSLETRPLNERSFVLLRDVYSTHILGPIHESKNLDQIFCLVWDHIVCPRAMSNLTIESHFDGDDDTTGDLEK